MENPHIGSTTNVSPAFLEVEDLPSTVSAVVDQGV
jgi:hypothetical protein